MGTAIAPLTLPAASGGRAPLRYALTPTVPGLIFDPGTRTVTGTPTTTGSYRMIYAATDAAGARATLTFVTFVVDPAGVRRVRFQSNPASGDTYALGETIEVDVHFDRVVTVTGTPRLALTIGSADRQVAMDFVFGNRQGMKFSYVVQEGDRDADGISVGPNALTLNGGTVRDADGWPVDLDLGEHAITDDVRHKVDGSVTRIGCPSWQDGCISSADRSLFLDARYKGMEHRQLEVASGVDGCNWSTEDCSVYFRPIDAHLFDARFADGTTVEISFDADDFDLAYAERNVDVIADYYGRVPFFLRDRMPGVHIVSTDKFGGACCGSSYRWPVTLTGSGTLYDRTYILLNHLNMDTDPPSLSVIIHELAHYVDVKRNWWTPDGVEREYHLSGGHAAPDGHPWLLAAAADGEYISEYAKTNPVEDFAETMAAYVATRHHRDRLTPSVLAEIERSIPNRLAYLDAVLDDHGRMCPFVAEDCP